MITTTDTRLAELAAALTGALHLPGDDDYPRLATPWNVAVPSRPLAIAAVADAADVAEALRWAARHGMRVAVRATGHGAVDPLDDTVLIHTGRLDEVTVLPTGSARVGAGATGGALAAAAAAAGFAPLGGSAPTVGVVGLLTGGGLGPLSRTYGVCADRATAFELVTGDGVVRRVSAEEEPDLFWGVRGGKGALGIVTAVELDLLPDDRILAGALFFDGADAAAVLRAWAAWCPTLPGQATTSIALTRLPDLPVIPAPIAGRLAVSVRFAWAGEEAAGQALIDPIRAVAPLIMGGVGPMPASAVGAIHGDPTAPTPTHEHAAMLSELPADAVDAVLATAGPESDCSLMVVEIRQLGGAIAEEPAAPSAFPGREIGFTLNAIGIAAGPLTAVTDAHGVRVAEAVAPWTHQRRLPNFEPTSDPRLLVATYGEETVGRLAALADRFDPQGVIASADPIRSAAALGAH